MTRKKKIITVLIVIAILAFGIVVWWRWRMANRAAEAPQGSSLVLPPAPVLGEQQATSQGLNPTTISSAISADAVARSFAERWGSFSTETDFTNVQELYPSMTTTMSEWAHSYVTRERAKRAGSSEYYGVTTRAMTIRVMTVDADGTRFRIGTQRRELKGSTERIFYQDMEVLVKKEGDVWKVDGVWWK